MKTEHLINVLASIIVADNNLMVFDETFGGFTGNFKVTKHIKALFKGQYETIIEGDLDKINMMVGLEAEEFEHLQKSLGDSVHPTLTIDKVTYKIRAIKIRWGGNKYDTMIKL